MKVLGFIPARGGSKGIARKNLTPVAGKPLIAYTLDAAVSSRAFSEILVSTEDLEIARFASGYSIRQGYVRPVALATDDAKVIDCVFDALDWFKREHRIEFDAVAILQPTSPLRTALDVKEAVRVFGEKNVDSLVAVSPMAELPQDCVKQEANGEWSFLVPPSAGASRRQDYASNRYFFVNGAIYIRKVESLLRTKEVFEAGRSYLFEMPKSRGIDIDEPHQLKMAEALLS